MTDGIEGYATQTVVTEPGAGAARLTGVPATLAGMADAARPLVFHYREGGDWAANGVPPERIADIDLRYADDMLRRLGERADCALTDDRAPAERLVGCCRDTTVLFLAMVRRHGIPARMRVGFATYFADGWYLDHAVAEVWDETEARWRLVDAEMAPGYRDPATGREVNRLDLQAEDFLTGQQAWRATRSGEIDADRFVMVPDIKMPRLRGWPYLRHNLMLDVAALNGHEMLLWDVWGIDLPDEISDADRALLDAAADATHPGEIRRLGEHDGLRVPPVVLSISPADPGSPREVTLRAVAT